MLYSHTIKLVRFKEGVDGLKTGYTESAGYCLTATMKKDNMRVIATVMGEEEANTRNSEVSSMLDYAFAQYKVDKIIDKDSIVKKISIEKAKLDTIEIVPISDVTLLNKKTESSINPKYKIVLNDIKLPLKKGEVVGKLYVKDGKEIIKEVDLTVKEDIKKANIIELFNKYISDIISGNILLKNA